MTSPPPAGESLKDTAARVLPYYIQEILPRVLRGDNVLVAAHGNSLRALVMVLEGLSPEEIVPREIATGVPLIYRLNAEFDGVGKTGAGRIKSSAKSSRCYCPLVPAKARESGDPALCRLAWIPAFAGMSGT